MAKGYLEDRPKRARKKNSCIFFPNFLVKNSRAAPQVVDLTTKIYIGTEHPAWPTSICDDSQPVGRRGS